MAHSVESHISTPIAELRQLLDQAERQLPMLDSATVVAYLTRLDRIAALFTQLEAGHAAQGASIDQALRAGEPALFIIHGHGTGALRAAVREHLGDSELVSDLHPAEPREGGEGVTVVWLK
jgi:hypothetical protein